MDFGKRAETADAKPDRTKARETPASAGAIGGNLAGAMRGSKAFSLPIKSLPKLQTDGKHVLRYALWIAMIVLSYMAYSENIYATIKNLPSKRQNLAILKANVAQQEQEIKALKDLSLNSTELEKKEALLDSYIPSDGPKVAMRQLASIEAMVKRSGSEIGTLTKISEDRRDDSVDKLSPAFDAMKINNFYKHAWYNSFVLETTASEDSIMRLKEEIERDRSMLLEAYTADQSDNDIKYSVKIKALYTLNKTENVSH